VRKGIYGNESNGRNGILTSVGWRVVALSGELGTVLHSYKRTLIPASLPITYG
jgi:hypothetical protein